MTRFNVSRFQRPLLFSKYLSARVYWLRTLVGYFKNPAFRGGYAGGGADSPGARAVANFELKIGCRRQDGSHMFKALLIENLIGLYLKKLREDVVVVLNPAGGLGGKMIGKKVVVDLMDMYTCGDGVKIPEIDLYTLRRVDLVVAWSKAIASILRGLGVANVHYAPAGVDLDIFDPVRVGPKLFFEKYRDLEGQFLIGYSGGMWHVEGREVLGVVKVVEAFSELEKRRRDVYLVLQTSSGVLELVKRYGVKRYVLVGQTPMFNSPERLSMLSALDVFVLPTTKYPAVYFAERSTLFQAMAAGSALVVESSPGTVGVIRHGRNGLVAAYGDVGDFVSNVEWLVDDKSLARVLGSSARRDVEERYQWRSIAKGLKRRLKELSEV